MREWLEGVYALDLRREQVVGRAGGSLGVPGDALERELAQRALADVREQVVGGVRRRQAEGVHALWLAVTQVGGGTACALREGWRVRLPGACVSSGSFYKVVLHRLRRYAQGPTVSAALWPRQFRDLGA